MRRTLELHDLIYGKVSSYLENDLGHTADPIRIGNDEWDIIKWERVPEIDPMLGVVVGELIHDVRSSLDQLIYELVSENDKSKTGEHSQFPIYDSEKKWIDDIEERDPARWPPSPVLGLKEDQVGIIRELQPFHFVQKDRPRHPLVQLLRMSNVDKHRTIHLAAMNVRPPAYVRYEPPGFFKILKQSMKRPGAEVKKDTEIGRVKRQIIGVPPPGTQVQLRIRGGADIEFSEPGKEPIAGLRDIGIIMWEARRIILTFRPDADIPFPEPTEGQANPVKTLRRIVRRT